MSSAAVGLSPAPVRSSATSQPLLVPFCAAVIYALVVVLMVLHHEPWADEAQAWLLARDASLWDLWTRLMHYEGSPGIWLDERYPARHALASLDAVRRILKATGCSADARLGPAGALPISVSKPA